MSKPPTTQPIQPVILSGGAGTRLWPLSRRHRPKQFLPIVTDEPLLIDTARRVADPSRYLPPVFVANAEHRFMIAEAMRDAGLPSGDIVLEAEGRNTAPSVAAAALLAAEADPNRLVLVLPSDHVVKDTAAFAKALDAGVAAALNGRITVFGITPDRPDTGYGYIAAGAQVEGTGGAYDVLSFREKPSPEIAEKLLAEGTWTWNSGMFLFRACDAIGAFEAHAPEVLSAARDAIAKATRDLDFLRLEADAWRRAPALPFDKAVMERIDNGAVIHTDMGWSDIGTWSTIAAAGSPDNDGNVLFGTAVAEDVRDCVIHSDGPLVAAVGLTGMAIVAARDAVLIMPKDRAQDVRTVVERLERENRPELVGTSVTYRPWGHYEEIDEGPGFKVKRLVVNPGQRLSRQLHHRRSEHWVVVSGTANVLCGAEEVVIEPNQSIYIPVETEHRLENKGDVPLQVIEVQTGDYLEEDDIVRFEDIYGRA